MTIPTCNHCGRSEPEPQALVHPLNGEALRLCGPCLRAMARAKAAWSDERGRDRLVKAAEQGVQEVWRSDHVVYLLPPMADTKAPSATQAEPSTPVGER